MLVTKVLRTQSGRIWLRQNVGIVGTPCVVHRPRLAPTSLLPPARATLPSSSPDAAASPSRTTLPPPLRIRSGFRGDVTQWLTTCKAGDADRRVRRRFRGNVTQYLPVNESLSPAPPLAEVGAGDKQAEVTFYSDLGPPG